jgi:hypothetical protein
MTDNPHETYHDMYTELADEAERAAHLAEDHVCTRRCPYWQEDEID